MCAWMQLLERMEGEFLELEIDTLQGADQCWYSHITMSVVVKVVHVIYQTPFVSYWGMSPLTSLPVPYSLKYCHCIYQTTLECQDQSLFPSLVYRSFSL